MNIRKPLFLAIAVALSTSAAPTLAEPGTGFSASGARGASADLRGPGDRGSRRGGPRHRLSHMFESLDTNGDELVTLDEFLAKPAEKAAKFFDRVDTDDDGLISEAEFLAAAERRGERHPDVDRDAVRACVEEALGESLPERPDAETRFEALDSNGDGFIDLDELTDAKLAQAEAKFAEIDADGDGAITKEELADSLLAQRERREQVRSCVDEQLDETTLIGG